MFPKALLSKLSAADIANICGQYSGCLGIRLTDRLLLPAWSLTGASNSPWELTDRSTIRSFGSCKVHQGGVLTPQPDAEYVRYGGWEGIWIPSSDNSTVLLRCVGLYSPRKQGKRGREVPVTQTRLEAECYQFQIMTRETQCFGIYACASPLY